MGISEDVRSNFAQSLFVAPCSDADLARAETVLGEDLPSALRELYRDFDGFRDPDGRQFLWPLFALPGTGIGRGTLTKRFVCSLAARITDGPQAIARYLAFLDQPARRAIRAIKRPDRCLSLRRPQPSARSPGTSSPVGPVKFGSFIQRLKSAVSCTCSWARKLPPAPGGA